MAGLGSTVAALDGGGVDKRSDRRGARRDEVREPAARLPAPDADGLRRGTNRGVRLRS
jgi:hypothetical protein